MLDLVHAVTGTAAYHVGKRLLRATFQLLIDIRGEASVSPQVEG